MTSKFLIYAPGGVKNGGSAGSMTTRSLVSPSVREDPIHAFVRPLELPCLYTGPVFSGCPFYFPDNFSLGTTLVIILGFTFLANFLFTIISGGLQR